jgi:hypothetical protein
LITGNTFRSTIFRSQRNALILPDVEFGTTFLWSKKLYSSVVNRNAYDYAIIVAIVTGINNVSRSLLWTDTKGSRVADANFMAVAGWCITYIDWKIRSRVL